jgi:TldD protein
VTLAPTASDRQVELAVQHRSFGVPLGERVEALLAGARRAWQTSTKLKVQGSLVWVSQEKTIGNTRRLYFEQRFLRGQPMLNVTAIDVKSGQFEGRAAPTASSRAADRLRGAARHALTDAPCTPELAQKRLGATPVERRQVRSVIAPSNLWLTIHEIDRPSDRARSHARLRSQLRRHVVREAVRLGKLKYGSPLVNVVADRTQEHALGTVGWDDDGQPGDKWDLIQAAAPSSACRRRASRRRGCTTSTATAAGLRRSRGRRCRSSACPTSRCSRARRS